MSPSSSTAVLEGTQRCTSADLVFNGETQRDMSQTSFEEHVALDPEHPILARTQAALKHQLSEAQLRLEGELREKEKLLSDAEKHKEHKGVELFNYQHQLAKLQMELERSHEAHVNLAGRKDKAEEAVRQLREEHAEAQSRVTADRTRADQHHEELDRQTDTLRKIEAYNAKMKGEIAVTRRATYKTEESVQQLEKEKLHQDTLLEKLQENLKGLHETAAMYTAQHGAQQKETRAAMETLVEAEKEMESIHFEKRQLVAQWRASIQAISRREEALAAISAASAQQREQELTIVNELSRFEKDNHEQEVRNETLASVMQRLDGEIQHVQRNIEVTDDKAQHLDQVFLKLERAQADMDEKLRLASVERKALERDALAVDKAYAKAASDNSAIEAQMVSVLGDQTTVEKGSSGATKEIRRTQDMAREKEVRVVTLQNEVAKLGVDVLNTDGHNLRLEDTLKLLDGDLTAKADTIEKIEIEMRRRNDDIEKKTRQVDVLNRTLEKLISGDKGEEAGPLEATISSLHRELKQKEDESKAMQREWINLQSGLVAKQEENGKLGEAQARLKSSLAVLTQKRLRMEGELKSEAKETAEADKQLQRAGQDMTRLNSLVSKHNNLVAEAKEDVSNLERGVKSELQDMEAQARRLEASIDDAGQAKQTVLAEIVETEHQIMLWERKLQLEREMQAVLEPSVGQDVLGSMKREIHRMELRSAELEQTKEHVLKELERAISKRDTIQLKGVATVANSKRQGGKLTSRQFKRSTKELAQGVRETDAECVATDARIATLQSRLSELAERIESDAHACQCARSADGNVRQVADAAVRSSALCAAEKDMLTAVVAHIERADEAAAANTSTIKDAHAARDSALRKRDAIRDALQRVQHRDGVHDADGRLRDIALRVEASNVIHSRSEEQCNELPSEIAAA